MKCVAARDQGTDLGVWIGGSQKEEKGSFPAGAVLARGAGAKSLRSRGLASMAQKSAASGEPWVWLGWVCQNTCTTGNCLNPLVKAKIFYPYIGVLVHGVALQSVLVHGVTPQSVLVHGVAPQTTCITALNVAYHLMSSAHSPISAASTMRRTNHRPKSQHVAWFCHV